MSRATSRGCSAQRLAGFSLVELMVALAIGSLLIVGALSLFSDSRRTYAVSESVARLQEQGRYVLSVIEPDVELAGYLGFSNVPDTVRLISGGDPGNVLATPAALRQIPLPPAAPTPAPVAGLPSGSHACGANFAVDVLQPIQGSNDSFELGPDRTAACDPYLDRHQEDSDTLTVRRASTETSAARAGRIQLFAARLRSQTSQQLFGDGLAPAALDPDNEVHDYIVRSYYVARDSVDRPGLPALRVKGLTEVGGNAAFVDNEVMPGVEDFQVQFGIDTGDYDNDGAIDPGADANGDGIPESDGRATRYVDPDFPDLARFQIVAVRVWVRLRAEQPEVGFVDGRTYRYANREFTPIGAERGYRRLLVSRTITLRNARTL